MSRSRKALGILCAAAAGVFSGGASPDPDSMAFGRRGEGTIFDSICRSTASTLPPPRAVIDFIIAEGGRTCFAGGEGVLFVPRRGGACAQPHGLGLTQPVVISHRQAQSEMRQCHADYRPPAKEPVGVLIYSPTADAVDFLQFGLDVGTLVAFDMLPVTHFGAANGVICLEAPDPQMVAQRVIAAEIAGPEEFDVEITYGSCREATRARTGRSWPVRVEDGD